MITTINNNPVSSLEDPKSDHKIRQVFNNAIETITALGVYLKEASVHLRQFIFQVKWTETKTKQVFLAAASAYFCIGARSVAGSFFPTSIALFAQAAPFALLSGALLFYCTSMIDYEDPKILNQIRLEAPTISFSTLLKKHGLENLFVYEIIDNTSFQKGYQSFTETLGFKEILDLYLKASDLLEKKNITNYSLPPLEKEARKFQTETKELSLTQILEKYPKEILKKHKILTTKQIEILEQVEKRAEESEGIKDRILKEAEVRCEDEDLSLSKDLAKLEASYRLETSSFPYKAW